MLEESRKREEEYRAREQVRLAEIEQRRRELIEKAKSEPSSLNDIQAELADTTDWNRRRMLLQKLSWSQDSESREFAEEQWLTEMNSLLDKIDFKKIVELLEDLQDDNPLVTKSDFLMNTHESLVKFGKHETGSYGLTKYYNKPAYQACASVVQKMGNNPENLMYLNRIFYEDRVPYPALAEIVDLKNVDAFLDNYDEANYFRNVISALKKMNTDESVAAIAILSRKGRGRAGYFFRINSGRKPQPVCELKLIADRQEADPDASAF